MCRGGGGGGSWFINVRFVIWDTPFDSFVDPLNNGLQQRPAYMDVKFIGPKVLAYEKTSVIWWLDASPPRSQSKLGWPSLHNIIKVLNLWCTGCARFKRKKEVPVFTVALTGIEQLSAMQPILNSVPENSEEVCGDVPISGVIRTWLLQAIQTNSPHE